MKDALEMALECFEGGADPDLVNGTADVVRRLRAAKTIAIDLDLQPTAEVVFKISSLIEAEVESQS